MHDDWARRKGRKPELLYFPIWLSKVSTEADNEGETAIDKFLRLLGMSSWIDIQMLEDTLRASGYGLVSKARGQTRQRFSEDNHCISARPYANH